MDLSPRLYHRMVRPRWVTAKYIHDPIRQYAELANHTVLDFGCGTGANSIMCQSSRYYGIDPDAARIRLAGTLYPAHTFLHFDGTRIPVGDGVIDVILIVAVLHHISSEQIAVYLNEFRRVLKPEGKIMVIEPFLCPRNKLNNWFMLHFDHGAYIRSADQYLQLFHNCQYKCEILKKFKKCILYHELFFTAIPY